MKVTDVNAVVSAGLFGIRRRRVGLAMTMLFAVSAIALFTCKPIEPKTRPVGMWTDVPYQAKNFTCSGPGCEWNVTEKQQINYSYTVIGKTMLMQFTLQGVTVKSPEMLTLAIPGGYTVARRSDAFPIRCYNGKEWTDGYANLGENGTVMVLYYQTGEPWPNGSIEVSGLLITSVN